MSPTFPPSVRPRFATIELLHKVVVVSLIGLTISQQFTFALGT
jgi:hypothetical protein